MSYENDTGRTWQRAKDPERVGIHDFPAPEVPRTFHYGIDDVAAQNTAFLNIGKKSRTRSSQPYVCI